MSVSTAETQKAETLKDETSTAIAPAPAAPIAAQNNADSLDNGRDKNVRSEKTSLENADVAMSEPATATSDIAQSNATSPQIEARLDAAHDATQNSMASGEESLLHELISTDAQHGFQNYGRLPVAFVRGDGARLWDSDGKEYLDFLGGIAVVTVGHSHPEITRAVSVQAATLLHTSNIYYIEPQVRLAEKLSQLSGGMRAFFCNSGAEANEAALKLVRKYFSTKSSTRFEIISTLESFHGRTYASLAATGQPKYHEGFAPMPAGFSYVERNNFEALQAAVNERTAAILLEPIQGESGVWPCSIEYLKSVRQLCDEHGILLIFDEVQTGIGRTGKFFAHEWSGIRPDIITLAKGLANGIPIGAMLARDEVAQAFVPGTHGCTFGGNFLSCAAALATLRVLESEDVMQNALEVGCYFYGHLQALDFISDVRGSGLMIGATTTKPIARELMKASLNNGLIFNAVGDSYLRFLPPLTISKNDVDDAMNKIRVAYQSLK